VDADDIRTILDPSMIAQTRSTALISDPSKDATMVASLLDFKHTLDAAVAAIYDFDPHAETAAMTPDMIVKEEKRRLVLENEVREGLKHGVETRQAKPAEMIGELAVFPLATTIG
jgi:hypothetical protein